MSVFLPWFYAVSVALLRSYYLAYPPAISNIGTHTTYPWSLLGISTSVARTEWPFKWFPSVEVWCYRGSCRLYRIPPKYPLGFELGIACLTTWLTVFILRMLVLIWRSTRMTCRPMRFITRAWAIVKELRDAYSRKLRLSLRSLYLWGTHPHTAPELEKIFFESIPRPSDKLDQIHFAATQDIQARSGSGVAVLRRMVLMKTDVDTLHALPVPTTSAANSRHATLHCIFGDITTQNRLQENLPCMCFLDQPSGDVMIPIVKTSKYEEMARPCASPPLVDCGCSISTRNVEAFAIYCIAPQRNSAFVPPGLVASETAGLEICPNRETNDLLPLPALEVPQVQPTVPIIQPTLIITKGLLPRPTALEMRRFDFESLSEDSEPMSSTTPMTYDPLSWAESVVPCLQQIDDCSITGDQTLRAPTDSPEPDVDCESWKEFSCQAHAFLLTDLDRMHAAMRALEKIDRCSKLFDSFISGRLIDKEDDVMLSPPSSPESPGSLVTDTLLF